MPEFELPEIPAAIIAVLGLVTPWLLALVNQPHWSPLVKRLIAVAGSVVLSLAVLVWYYAWAGDPWPAWPQLVLLGLLVSQATYALIAQPSAKALEQKTSREVPIFNSGGSADSDQSDTP